MKFKVENYVVRDITMSYPHIIESVESRFDDVLDIIQDLEKTFIYGGFIRDVIAKVPILGDIDIVTDNPRYVKKRFNSNLRWDRKVEQDTHKTEESTNQRKSFIDTLIKKPKYKNMSVNLNVNSFINTFGYEAQIISYETNLYDDNALIKEVIESLDFICCGFIMKPNGQVLEIIEGAVEDCEQQILRVNPYYKNKFDKTRFEKRLDKLHKRGWEFVGDLNEIEFAEEKQEDIKEDKDKETEQNKGRRLDGYFGYGEWYKKIMAEYKPLNLHDYDNSIELQDEFGNTEIGQDNNQTIHDETRISPSSVNVSFVNDYENSLLSSGIVNIDPGEENSYGYTVWDENNTHEADTLINQAQEAKQKVKSFVELDEEFPSDIEVIGEFGELNEKLPSDLTIIGEPEHVETENEVSLSEETERITRDGDVESAEDRIKSYKRRMEEEVERIMRKQATYRSFGKAISKSMYTNEFTEQEAKKVYDKFQETNKKYNKLRELYGYKQQEDD